MRFNDDVSIFSVPYYDKRGMRFRAEVVAHFDTNEIYRKDYDGKWHSKSYLEEWGDWNDMLYDNESQAIESAIEFAKNLTSISSESMGALQSKQDAKLIKWNELTNAQKSSCYFMAEKIAYAHESDLATTLEGIKELNFCIIAGYLYYASFSPV